MRLFFLFFIFILNGCATPDFDRPIVYKMEIQQGNEIDSEMLFKLKPGMTKSQVKFILGTPLIADSFHKDRWDYIYVLSNYNNTKNKLGVTERRHVVLNFEQELLKGITGEVIPSKGNLDVNKKEKLKEHIITKETNNENQVEEDSWMEKIKFWENDESSQTEVNEIKEEEFKDRIKNDKENQKEEIRDKVIQETEFENVILDTKDSVNAVIRKDISKEKEVRQLKINESDPERQAEAKQDIIEEESAEQDYFDLMLEKIGF